MESHKTLTKIGLLLLTSILFFSSGCGHSLQVVKNNFYDYNGLSSELTKLHTEFQEIVSMQPIGKTYEGRSIFAVRITGNVSNQNNKPALMAIFTQHGDEHDVTDLAVGIIKYLADNYGKDKRVTDLLNQKEVWIVPMMNPDGVEYDLSGAVKPFSWRKNRRPTGEGTYGVDLNRNWGRKWDASIPEDLAKDLSDKNSPFYAGEEPFSEKETQAMRDFLLSHPNITIFVDYHSGSAGFLQGGVGFPIPCSEEKEDMPPRHKKRYEEIAEKFAREISNPKDKRPGFIVNKECDVAKTVKKYAPWYIKPFVPKSLPIAPGTSGEWVYGELGIMVFGVEIMRDEDFFERLPESKNELVENQVRGVLFSLDVLSDEPFR